VYISSVRGVQCTVAGHVDDLLITCTDQGRIDELVRGMKTTYGVVKTSAGPVVGYLGMTLDMSGADETKITMNGYVEEMLKARAAGKVVRTPAIDNLFTISDDVSACDEEGAIFIERWLECTT
jgi:hypothetical protein